MAEEPPLTDGRRFRLSAMAAVALLAAATGVQGQDPVRGDTLVQTLPDSAREVFGQARRKEPAAFPARRGALRGPATEVFECDRECVQASTALSLLDLLSENVPGIRPLRGGFFDGPHHLFDGIYGAGFVTLRVDGREIPSLERAQTDLRRLSLISVASVRVYREAAGLIIDVDTYRHDSAEAYSRIGGGTGSPSLQTLNASFANGLSSAFTVEAAIDLLDNNAGNVPNDRFEAAARLSWMPKGNDFGMQFEYRSETVDRTGADTADITRKSLLMRARGNLGEEGQVEVYGAMSDYRLKPKSVIGDSTGPTREANVLGARLTAPLGAGRGTVDARFSGGTAYPSLQAEISTVYPVGPLSLEGGLDFGNWTDFSASSLRGAAAFTDTLLVPITLRAFAASGDRGISLPALDRAESVGFSSYGVAGEFQLGSTQVSGRYATQRLDRQIGLGASFDSAAVLDSTQVDVTSWEARLEGPLIPIGTIIHGLNTITVRAFYRQNSAAGPLPIYVPDNIGRVELLLHDLFFQGNLEFWLNGYIERRGQRLVPRPGEADLVGVSSFTWPGGQIMFRIADFRLFYRFANPAGRLVFDIPGANFPLNEGLFGIQWQFFN